jgi:hypothetical protein
MQKGEENEKVEVGGGRQTTDKKEKTNKGRRRKRKRRKGRLLERKMRIRIKKGKFEVAVCVLCRHCVV